MSHDRNGTLLKKGDIVTVEFFVTDITPGEEYCNVTLQSTAGRKPDGMRETMCGNAAVCVLQRRATIIKAVGGLADKQESYGGTD